MTRKTEKTVTPNFNTFKRLAATGILALAAMTAAPLAAQQATSNAETQLDLGTPADGSPQIGDRYSKEKIGDWDLACIKTESGDDPCSLLQILRDASGNPVAEVSIFPLESAGPAVAGATIIVPLEVLLPAQVTIGVDGAAGKRYNYSFCNPIGCIAQIGFTEEDVQAFKQGGKATMTIVPAPAPEQKVVLDMSLKGFTAGFGKVEPVKE